MIEDRDGRARVRYMAINAVRIGGLIMVMLGFAIVAGKLPDIPVEVGYVLVALGLAEFLIAPLMLARIWRTPPQ